MLVVDDDEDLRDLVCSSLEADGYVVHAANDGNDALDRLNNAELPDLVLLDLEMPVMSGWELIRRLRSIDRCSSLPVLVMSGAEPADAPAGVPFIAKPASLQRLLAAVRRETSGRRRRSGRAVAAREC